MAVDVTMEDIRNQEGDEREEKNEDQETEESGVVELDGDEQERKQESDDDVQFVGSVEGDNEEEDVLIMENGEATSHTERSRADTDAMMAANGFVTPATLEAELQCIICQYAMFKPVSAICGHSFCRVCLMDSFLTRPIEEAKCPICRVDILQPISAKSSLASVFSVNVTLWNLTQLLIPSVVERISSYQDEEEQEFSQKLDKLDVKWKSFTLNERAAIYHGDHEVEEASARWEYDHEGHEEYPVLKVEDTRDGNLYVSRNVVLDTNDENEDGYVNMRVGIAIVEFPSIFELYNEHQECSVNVIKMEEDEEMADGMPFFMNEDGDDDGFVCSSYYNEISLRVCDEAGNCVMERTRGAQGGVVSFPGLRLDVPGGLYTFRFSDDLYGLKLSITTRLREPHEISDTPVADYVSVIQGEARDGSRRNRNIHHDSDYEEDHDEEGNEWDDSFIVDDLNGRARHEEPVGRFSDGEDESRWGYHSDNEAADEEREQRRLRQRQRLGRRSERDVQFVDEDQEGGDFYLSGGENDHEDFDGGEHEAEAPEEDEEVDDELHPGRRNVRVVEETMLSSDGEAKQEENDDSDGDDGKGEEEQHETFKFVRSRRRNTNQIVDSEDEDEVEGASAGIDEEKKEDAIGYGAQTEHDENNIMHSDGGAEVDDHGSGGDDEDEDEDTIVQPLTRKVKRAQWFEDDDESNEENEQPAMFSVDQRAEAPRRPRKRTRARDRQVRVVDEGESDGELEQMERSIIAANSYHVHNDDNDEDDGRNSQFRQVHVYDEEETEGHEYEDEQQYEYDAPDYPYEENEYQEEEDGDY